jgi:nitrite reductase/ring-hydroxylating ferredoxin subunit
VAILHGAINFVGNGAFAYSLIQRMNGQHDAGFWVFLVGYVLISVGSYIGGHLVFKHGYAVNYNSHSRGKRAKDFTPVMAAAELEEGTPTKTMFGSSAVMLVRRGDVVHALKETCSHLGGPLSQGELDGDTITCPWHFSKFRLRDGSVVHGPATSRQLCYETRITDGQVELRGPQD